MSYSSWNAKKKAFAIKKRKEDEARPGSRYRIAEFEEWYPFVAYFGAPIIDPALRKGIQQQELSTGEAEPYDLELHRGHAEASAKHLLNILLNGVDRGYLDGGSNPPIFPPRDWNEFALAYSWRDFTQVYRKVPVSDLIHTMVELHQVFRIKGTDDLSIKEAFAENASDVWEERRRKVDQWQYDLKTRNSK